MKTNKSKPDGEEHAVQGSTTIRKPFDLMRDPQSNNGNRGRVEDYLILFDDELAVEVRIESGLIEKIVKSLNDAYRIGWEECSRVLMNRTNASTGDEERCDVISEGGIPCCKRKKGHSGSHVA